MSQGPRLAVPALVSSCCLVLSACGGDNNASPGPARAPETTAAPKKPPTVNAARVESALLRNLRVLPLPAAPATLYPKGGGPPQQSQVGGGRLKVRSVTCPRGVPLQKGGTFSCDVAARGAGASVRVKQLDATGHRLGYTARVKSQATGIPVVTRLHGKIKIK